MTALLPIHVAGGLVALAAGAVALSAAKGAKLHRQSGKVFVVAMAVMALSAIVAGLLRGQRFNAAQGALAFYLVATGILAVSGTGPRLRWAAAGAMLLALLVGAYDFSLGLEALQRPRRSIDGVPAAAIFLFGSIAILATLADLRMLLGPALAPHRRIARHLWRMCFALWIATASFFLGQAKMIPEPLRIKPLLAAPVLIVMGLMIYWLVRVLRRRRWA